MALYDETELKFGILKVLKLQDNKRVTAGHLGFCNAIGAAQYDFIIFWSTLILPNFMLQINLHNTTLIFPKDPFPTYYRIIM